MSTLEFFIYFLMNFNKLILIIYIEMNYIHFIFFNRKLNSRILKITFHLISSYDTILFNFEINNSMKIH